VELVPATLEMCRGVVTSAINLPEPEWVRRPERLSPSDGERLKEWTQGRKILFAGMAVIELALLIEIVSSPMAFPDTTFSMATNSNLQEELAQVLLNEGGSEFFSNIVPNFLPPDY